MFFTSYSMQSTKKQLVWHSEQWWFFEELPYVWVNAGCSNDLDGCRTSFKACMLLLVK